MKTAILLVLVTLNPAGQTGVNFVATDDMDTCQSKTFLLSNILKGGGIGVLENRCIESPLQFTKYAHKGKKGASRQTFLVRLGEGGVEVKEQPGMAVCEREKAGQEAAAGSKTYCATSIQRLLGKPGS